MTESAKPSRLGRTAALVQGLGLLAAGIVAAALFWMDMQSGEAYAVVAVGSAAACVFLFWSLVLAVRAITGGERANWPLVIVLLTLLEIGLPCLGLWSEVLEDHHNTFLNFLIWLGLPVFGPFVALGSLIAAPIALRRARKAEAAESAAGVKSWRRKTWKVWLAWYAGVMAMLGIFLLPGPLFLLGATAPQFYVAEEDDWDLESPPNAWAGYLAQQSPNLLRDTVESMLKSISDGPFYRWTMGRVFTQRIVLRGYVSKSRLLELARKYGTTPLWQTLARCHPEEALRYAEAIGKDNSAGVLHRSEAAKYIARHGSIEQLRYFVNPRQELNFWFQAEFINSLDGNDLLTNMTDDLCELALQSKKPLFRRSALNYIALYGQPDGVRETCRKILAQENIEVKREAASQAYVCVQRDLPDVGLNYLMNAERSIGRETVISIAVYREGLRLHLFRNPKNVEYLKLTSRSFEMISDADPVVRLAAACILGEIFCEGDGDALRGRISERLRPYQLSPDVTIDLEPDELAEIEKVKSTVAKWLKENAPEK